MRSFYIIAGGILVMAAVVFLAPKKKSNTEDKASIPHDEIDAHILKEYGADLSPEDKECIADQLARDKAEMRKYGRLLTDEERSAQWWQAQDEAEERAAWAEFYAEREEWIDNFPFQPRYHQNIVYDPENNTAHSTEKFHAYRKELEQKADDDFKKIRYRGRQTLGKNRFDPRGKRTSRRQTLARV